ncbi:hypothetical protein J6590_094291 [Homalodisca vitripennis]|nr:hypothetical protein J6590_094291 [Homalodisca vitripennis]
MISLCQEDAAISQERYTSNQKCQDIGGNRLQEKTVGVVLGTPEGVQWSLWNKCNNRLFILREIKSSFARTCRVNVLCHVDRLAGGAEAMLFYDLFPRMIAIHITVKRLKSCPLCVRVTLYTQLTLRAHIHMQIPIILRNRRGALNCEGRQARVSNRPPENRYHNKPDILRHFQS